MYIVRLSTGYVLHAPFTGAEAGGTLQQTSTVQAAVGASGALSARRGVQPHGAAGRGQGGARRGGGAAGC